MRVQLPNGTAVVTTNGSANGTANSTADNNLTVGWLRLPSLDNVTEESCKGESPS